MAAKKDLTGQVFGRLTVVEAAPHIHSRTAWKCQCSCGGEKSVSSQDLLNGRVSSCGCKWHQHGADSTAWKGFGDICGACWVWIRRQPRVWRRKNQLPFEISIEYAWELFLNQNKRCAISGVPINFFYENGKRLHDIKTASLDRVDSSKGYVKGNVQWVHKQVNTIKMDLSDEELVNWCKTIADYQRQKEKESGIQVLSKAP